VLFNCQVLFTTVWVASPRKITILELAPSLIIKFKATLIVSTHDKRSSLLLKNENKWKSWLLY